ncbi:hypothetical protein OUZ56_031141 [Daphnia magna]|uniref:Uncharacterized protein n=1 Tax=Daphnia magna TaxID=35525 RepID=A0ABQ9ZTE1_9CRUS|nr:hypothetical protein OUZ56_031141 [Daphnia magna]
MSLKKIRRRLSQTFRFSIESSLSELAEHLTIEESNGEGCTIRQPSQKTTGDYHSLTHELLTSTTGQINFTKEHDYL